MKYRFFLYLIIITCAIVSGCSNRTITTQVEEKDKELTRKEVISYQYALTEGIKKKTTGRLREAIPYFSECIRINPQSDAAMYELSTILTMAGNYKEAIAYSKKANKIDPGNIWYKLQLAGLYHAIGRKDSTIIVYEEIHKNYPDRTDFYYTLANLYGEYGKTSKAIKIFDELEEQYGLNETILLAKHHLYSNTGKLDEAEKEMLKLIETYPDEVRFYGLLAELYSSGNKDEKAIETYEKLFELDPNNALGQLSIIEFYKRKNDSENLFAVLRKLIDNEGVTTNQKIQALIEFFTNETLFRNNAESIGEMVGIMKKKHPEDLRIRTLKADYHVKVGEFENAAFELRYITEREKKNYVIWEQLLYVENSIGEYERLYNEAEEAAELFPGAPTIYLLRGIAAMELKKNREAITAFQIGIGLVEENDAIEVQFYSMLGEVYRNEGNNSMSDEMFQRALNIDNENLFVLNNYSYYLSLREERLEEALGMSKKCVDAESENSTYLDTYAWILHKMNKHKDALDYIEKAIKNSGKSNSEIVDHYGDILMEVGASEKALIQWKRAKELGKTSQELLEKIEKLEKELQLDK